MWTSQAQSVPVTNGVFSVVLETGTQVNLSTAVFAGARYVEITVNGVQLSPRQEMVSAPFAMIAQGLTPEARLSLSNLDRDPSSASTINTSTNAVDWTQLKNVPAGLADGTDDIVNAVLSTAAITSGKFGDERVSISTGAFYGGFNGPDKLVKLDGGGNLPALNGAALTGLTASSVAAANVYPGLLGSDVVASSVAAGAVQDYAIVSLSASKLTGALPALDGSALTGVMASSVAAVNVSSGTLANDVVASSVAAGVVYGAALQAGSVTDPKVLLTTAAIISGKFGDSRVSISTGAFYGGFNGPSQLVKLDSAGKLSTGTIVAGAIALPIKTILPADLPYTVTENDSTILINAATATGDVIVQLPDPAGIRGRVYTFKRLDNPGAVGAQIVYLVPIPGDSWKIDGNFVYDIYLNNIQMEAITLQSDGTDWMILSWYK